MTENEPLISEIFAVRQAIERLMHGMEEIKTQVDSWTYERRLARVEADLAEIRRHLRLDD